jgi:hypothetical protein
MEGVVHRWKGSGMTLCSDHLLLCNKSPQNLAAQTMVILSLYLLFSVSRELGKAAWVGLAWGLVCCLWLDMGGAGEVGDC